MAFLFPYETKLEKVSCGAVDLQIESLASLDRTIDLFFDDYERSGRAELFADLCPYFGVPWPAGKALATKVAKMADVWRGKKILELGCGLALPSLVLARFGCDISATDLHPDVPEFLRRNLAHNQIHSLHYRALDWRTMESEESFDVILASDVLYDKEQPADLFAFLARFLAPGGEFILADPGRPYFDRFLQLARESQIKLEETLEDSIFFLRWEREL